MLLGRSRLNRLEKGAPALPDLPPRVTIVVPAKDEAGGMRACVGGLLSQNYPTYDVLIVDDRSTDGTAEILDELAADGSFKVMHVPQNGLPPGWLGKCHALHRATREVESPWILFVDSDVTLRPDALRDTMALALERKYDAISLLTGLNGRTIWEKLMIPIAGGTWAIMFQVSMTNEDNRVDHAYANGQFILTKRDVYERAGNHEAVRGDVCEDCALFRRLKNRGARVRFLSGGHLTAITMHATLADLRSGWGRIYAGTDHYKPLRLYLTIAVVVVCGMGVYPAIGWGAYRWVKASDPYWLISAGAHFGLMTSLLAYIYHLARVRIGFALMWPVSAVCLVSLLLEGLRRCKTKTVHWRGTTFKAEV